MEARLIGAALLAAAIAALAPDIAQAASVRSQHFIVTAQSPELANEVCQAAERYRKELAIEWLGRELPPWRDMCPISVRLAPGAGGATSFMFNQGVPFGWTMNVQGSRERILDSVLPHEITHTIFATHFGRPLPRWADEGACTTVEHAQEKAKQDKFLIEFLHTDRGIPFNQMFAMKEYPRDILPLYSQGYSLTRFLIQQGGKRKFVQYVGEGMQTNNWTAVTRKYYDFASLSDLQVTWVKWVGEGSPAIEPRQPADGLAAAGLASAEMPRDAMPRQPDDEQTTAESFAMARQASAYGWQAPPAQNARAFAQAKSIAQPPAPSNFAAPATIDASRPGASNVSRPAFDGANGWYAKKRDQARGQVTAGENESPPPARHEEVEPLRRASYESPIPAPTRSAPAGNGRKVLMEWRREPASDARTDVRGLAVQDFAPLR
jgi:hypothetical protein